MHLLHLCIVFILSAGTGCSKRLGPPRMPKAIRSRESKHKYRSIQQEEDGHPQRRPLSPSGGADMTVALSPSSSSIKRSRRGVSPVLPTPKQDLASASMNALKSFTHSVTSMYTSLIPSAGVLQRRVKAYFSSDTETLLLRLTEPACEAPSAQDLALLTDLIGRLEQTHSALSDRNPYRVVMRKLWHKLAEPNPWTTVRAACTAHYMMMHVHAQDAAIVRGVVRQLQRESSSSKAGDSYFDRRTALQSLSSLSQCQDLIWRGLPLPEKKFLRAYVSFVLVYLASPAIKCDDGNNKEKSTIHEDAKLVDALEFAIDAMMNVTTMHRKRSLIGTCRDILIASASALLSTADIGGSDNSTISGTRVSGLVRRLEGLRHTKSK